MTSCTYLRDGVILMRALCPASAANNSEVQRITATGQTFCAPFDTFSEGVEPDTSDSNGCYSGIILGVNTSQECSIRCGSGYFGMDGALRCPANAIDGVTLPEEHITCSPVTCQALQLNADVVGKSEGGAGLVQCANDLVLRAGDSCAIECAIGYIAAGDGVMNCPLGASAGDVPDRSLSCIENQCSTVNFGPGIVADTSSTDARACSDGDFLTTLTDTSCALKCDDTAGYVAASAVLTCPRNATFGQDPVGHIMCEENRCAAINMTFAESLGAATSNRMSPGCIDGLRLSTHSTNACFLMCRSGFAGPGGNASCAVDAREGDAPTLSVSCEELFCAPLELGRAIVGDASDGGRPCIGGLVLSAVPGSSSQDEIDNSSCRVRCADGYTAIGDDSGAATCTPSDVPTIAPYISYASFRCEENLCAPLTFPTGIVPLTTGPFDTTSCVPGTVLSTYETKACRVQCAPGFVGEGSRIGVVACDPRSSPGDAAVFNISCVPDPVLRIGLECQQIRPGGCEVVEAAADDRDFRHSLWNCEGIESQNNSTRVLPGTDGGDVVVISGFSVRPTHDASVFYFLDVNGQRYENVSVGGLISSEDVCIFDSDNSSLRCPLPSGTGSGSSNALRIISFERFEVYGDTYEVGELIDTGLLGACYVEYARPRIDRVIGCPTEGCSRTGGDFVTVQGANFGDAASLIFIDGQSCEEVHHVDSAGNASTCDRNSKHQRLSPECHSFVACRTPPIFANLDISSLMLVQDSQFSMPVPESGFAYALCSPGHVPSSDNVAQCRPCEAGEFNDKPGAAFCEPCAPGFSNGEDGATECISCGQNEFSIRGATACEVCPGGSSSSAGSDTCEECSIFYSVPFAKVGHCDVPYFLYISGVVVALLLCIVTYRVVKSYRSRALEVTELQSKLKARHDDIGLLSEAWMISWDEINLLKRLAHGASGEVYRGTLRNRYDVAVKIMSSGSASIEDEKEIAFLKRCRHPRLVLFLGCGYRPNDGAIFLVLEFCEEGTLEDYLYAGAGTASQRPSWASRLQLLGDTAEGMLYLHLVLKTLHRDLKSPNVLLSMERGGGPEGLSKKLRAKVADFGTITKKVIIAPGPSKTKKKKSSSRQKRAKSSPQHRKLLSSSSHDSRSSIASKSDAVNERERLVLSSDNLSSSGNGSTKISDAMRAEMTLTAGVGSCLWMAPELHSSVRQNYASYTPAVDVFSFGIIMYEALECVQPWSLATELQFSYMIAEAVIAGRRPLLRSEPSAPPGYVDLMKRCWSQQASDRPTFDVVFGELQYMMMTSYKASLPKRPKRPRRAPKLPLRSTLSDILQRRIVKASNEASSHGQDGTVSVRTEATGIEMSNV